MSVQTIETLLAIVDEIKRDVLRIAPSADIKSDLDQAYFHLAKQEQVLPKLLKSS